MDGTHVGAAGRASTVTSNRQPGRELEGIAKQGVRARLSTEPARGPRSRVDTATDEVRWAYGLAWFGIGLGLAEVLAPRKFAQLIGAPPRYHRFVRALGLREIASGLAIFSGSGSPAAVWSRVLGDAVDLAFLGTASLSNQSRHHRLGVAAAAVAGAAILDGLCAQQVSRGTATRSGVTSARATTVIGRSPDELYRYWRDSSNLPQFMRHLHSVDVVDERRSHWVAHGPGGVRVEWDADLIDDRPGELIAWRSAEDADMDHAGSVRFEPAPGDRGTFVTVDLRYHAPAGALGNAVAALFGAEPGQTLRTDLRRFKQIMETGDVLTTVGQAAGRTRGTSWKYDRASKPLSGMNHLDQRRN